MNRRRCCYAHRQPPRGSARITLHAVLVCALVFLSRPAFADCFDSAASYQGVSATILRAIAWVESRGNPAAEHRNANGSVDIGELQINSVHLRELARFGIGVLALHDECVNVYVAAWHLKKKMIKYGNTWDAIGAYHSETPRQRDAYVRSIKSTLERWGVLPLSR
ncbi:lytic transglycosylase domain-containing protein [Paraburkholderia sp. SOS3]|uniref:lytic transglycosylase domain-containing protein n=1 Tax=Paraburkholderia sp. SOS3 TaxID=1926494 RepID=UPI0009F9EEE3|nr:lytic transglycosylase domain-containing protein [Paraburkholderia sp. SOS3]